MIKYDIVLYLIRDREQVTSVIKKANDFITFSSEMQNFSIEGNFWVGHLFWSIFSRHKRHEKEKNFPFEWFEKPGKLDFLELPP